MSFARSSRPNACSSARPRRPRARSRGRRASASPCPRTARRARRTSCLPTSSRSAGNSTVSSRAACGRYMWLKLRSAAASFARSASASGAFGERDDLIGQRAPDLVLAAQDRDEVGELAGLLEAREQEVLLELLVIVLDHAADDAGAADERVERHARGCASSRVARPRRRGTSRAAARRARASDPRPA